MIFLDPRTGSHGKTTPCRYYIIQEGQRWYCEQGAHGHEGTHNGEKPQSTFETELDQGYQGDTK